MEYDQDKVDEMTLALLWLVMHERRKGNGVRAWKSFGWDACFGILTLHKV